jgi:hypothetical protein
MPNGEPNEADIRDLREGEHIASKKGNGNGTAMAESAVGLIAAGEIDQAIATAHKYPRSITLFRKEATDMATLDEYIAADCLFALTRGTKVIEGPSIRLAEIIASCWRNCRVGSRIVLEGAETVIAQGIFHDLERNVQVQSEVARRIVDSGGRRYNLDMIVMTTNAAQAIAKRNAIQSGVPRALWMDVYYAARRTAAGKQESLQTKRAKAIEQFAIYGVTLEQILAKLNRHGIEEVTRDDLILLFGIHTAIKDEEITPENAFPRTVDVETLKAGNGKQDVSEKSDAVVTDKVDVAVRSVQKDPPPDDGKAGAAAETARVEAEKKPRAKRAPPPAME